MLYKAYSQEELNKIISQNTKQKYIIINIYQIIGAWQNNALFDVIFKNIDCFYSSGCDIILLILENKEVYDSIKVGNRGISLGNFQATMFHGYEFIGENFQADTAGILEKKFTKLFNGWSLMFVDEAAFILNEEQNIQLLEDFRVYMERMIYSLNLSLFNK